MAGADDAADAHTGDWLWHINAGAVQVIERHERWGEVTYRIWAPAAERVLLAGVSEVRPLTSGAPKLTTVLHAAAATRLQEAMATDLLLAPIRSSVTPLPHQLFALERAMAGKWVRHLFADEVGLGKTIEAGLVIRELKLRGLAQRILVVAPKGLTLQWQAEMQLHFGEQFRIAYPGEFEAVKRWTDEENIWRTSDQIVCSLDSVKPLARRRGWSSDKIAIYNQQRFEDLVTAGWDLVIIDEAHRLGGSTDQVARYKLGSALAEASPNLLLLSATPHSGKSDHFLRLMQLLDRDAFPNGASITVDNVQPYIVRTEKRRAINNDGNTLFKPRRTRLVGVSWSARHEVQRTLYEAVTSYVRHGYNQALKSKQRHIGFLMVLMQRLVTSSTIAIATTLRRRLEVLEMPRAQLSLDLDLDEEEIIELDGQSQLDQLIDWPGWRSEKAELEALLSLADRAATVVDAKVEELLRIIYQLEHDEGDPNLKVLIFTEFIPTQAMLAKHLRDRGIAVGTLNGQMTIDERLAAQKEFASSARILVSTDAGGEGLNLQFAHVIINFDLPWSPTRIEQRIGRVDRIGQKHTVIALNLVLEETVEHRVREVLDAKLATIAEEFGVDKAADILDSAEAEVLFDGIYMDGVISPELIERRADDTLETLRRRIRDELSQQSMLPRTSDLDPAAAQRWRRHPAHFWFEKAIFNGLVEAGGSLEESGSRRTIIWPDGSRSERVCFDAHATVDAPDGTLVSFDDKRAHALVDRLPTAVAGQRVPKLAVPGLPSSISGIWSIWRVEVSSVRGIMRRFVPLYIQNGRAFAPTARRIWDIMVSDASVRLIGELVDVDWSQLEELAIVQAEPIYHELKDRHIREITAERERIENVYQAQARAISRVGLGNVRRSRSERLQRDHDRRLEEIAASSRILPKFDPVIVVGIEALA